MFVVDGFKSRVVQEVALTSGEWEVSAKQVNQKRLNLLIKLCTCTITDPTCFFLILSQTFPEINISFQRCIYLRVGSNWIYDRHK